MAQRPALPIHMTRRLSAIALAFVITGAPVATTVCQVRCAAHDMDTAMATGGAEHHSCHTAAAAPEPTINGTAHVCGHPDDFQMGTDQSLQVVVWPAVVVATVSFTPPIAEALRLRSMRVEQSPPRLAALTSQLRV